MGEGAGGEDLDASTKWVRVRGSVGVPFFVEPGGEPSWPTNALHTDTDLPPPPSAPYPPPHAPRPVDRPASVRSQFGWRRIVWQWGNLDDLVADTASTSANSMQTSPFVAVAARPFESSKILQPRPASMTESQVPASKAGR